MKRLKAEVPKAELALSKAKLEADSLATRLTELTSRLDELEGHTDPTAEQEAELRALEKQLRVHDAAINKAKKASAALEADVQQLQQQILDAGGKPLEMAKADAVRKGLAAGCRCLLLTCFYGCRRRVPRHWRTRRKPSPRRAWMPRPPPRPPRRARQPPPKRKPKWRKPRPRLRS